MKVHVSLKHLEDETLIKLFGELDFFREYDREVMREIVKELAIRQKLFLLTKRL
ncbi:MAG: hypothetical protein WCA84_19010 [Ignavibacteriaceae bacterium]